MENVFEYLDYILKLIVQGKYIDEIAAEGAILVAVDIIWLCPSTFHGAGLEALRKRLGGKNSTKVPPTEDIIQIADFVQKNDSYEFNSEVKRQESDLHLLASSWKK